MVQRLVLERNGSADNLLVVLLQDAQPSRPYKAPGLMETARPTNPKLSQACKKTKLYCRQKPPVGLPSL